MNEHGDQYIAREEKKLEVNIESNLNRNNNGPKENDNTILTNEEFLQMIKNHEDSKKEIKMLDEIGEDTTEAKEILKERDEFIKNEKTKRGFLSEE